MTEGFDRSIREALFETAPPSFAPSPQERERTIAAIVAAANRERHRRRWIATAAIFAAAAIVVGVFLSLKRSPATSTPNTIARSLHGDSFRVRGDERTRLAQATELSASDTVVTGADGEAALELTQGTRLRLRGREARLVMISPAPDMSFELTAGTVAVDVRPLLAGERFVLRVDDVEVEVHGTSFEVERDELAPCEGVFARLRVVEGVVGVRRGNGDEVLVRRGEHWPTACDAPIASAPTASSFAPQPLALDSSSEPRGALPPPTAVAAPRLIKPTPPPPSSRAPSDLTAQNDLFERATTRRQEGDTTGALTAFDELLARFPNSHLAQSARVERMRLLKTVNRDQARAAARDYLQHHPNGFGRADAELILKD